MEVLGKIRLIGATQQVTASYKKRELVVTTDEQYPQHISIEFGQDKTDLLDNYNIGEVVKISINLRGREWVNPQGETKFFNSIQGWRIERQAVATATTNVQSPPMPTPETFAPVTNFKEEEADDLPF